MKTIYYFSGTGNTLYLAKHLKDNCSYSLIDLSQITNKKIKLEGEVGILFPIYAMGIPKIVQEFLENIQVGAITYLFAIATCGGSGYGIPFQQINKILKAKNLKLNYSEYCHMPDNYLKFFKPLSKDNAIKDIELSSSKIKDITNKINNKEINSNKSSLFYFFFLGIYKLWRIGLTSVHKKFIVKKDKCTSCKICEQVCPVNNIKLKDNFPIWNSSCQECLACVNLCPSIAIICGKKSKNNLRYKNPYISINELIK